MQIKLLNAADALSILTAADFTTAWESLYQACPWASAFQSPVFATAWYEFYHPRYAPLIIEARTAENALSGLLLLARNRASDAIVCCGDHQAEYQTWLAAANDGDEFIRAALNLLSEKFPAQKLVFRYLPAATPLQWLETDAKWRNLYEKTVVPRPLMEIGDGTQFTKSLKKPHHRTHLNRMKRSGEVRFFKVETEAEFAALFDEIIELGNFRLCAGHGYDAPPFDPAKKPFYLRMMRDGLLHTMVLQVGDHVAAAYISSFNHGELRGSILAYSPFFAKSSPANLLLRMMGERLAQEGIPIFDLTPYGAYKDTYATRYDEVTELFLFFNERQVQAFRANRKRREIAKNIIRKTNHDPQQLEQTLAKQRDRLRRVRWRKVPALAARILKTHVADRRELRVYRCTAEFARKLPPPAINFQIDSIRDLLLYRPCESWQPPVSDFLRDAGDKFAHGHHSLTLAEADQLLHWFWIIVKPQKSFLDEVGQTLYLPPNTATLSSAVTQTYARGRGIYTNSLRFAMRAAAELQPDLEQIFIYVLADNTPSRKAIEKVGFDYLCSFYQSRALGCIRHWHDAPPELVTPPPEKPAKQKPVPQQLN